MNFGNIIKKELISKTNKDTCCKRAFLTGFLRGSAVIIERDDGICLEYKVSSEELAMLINSYINILFDYEVREISFTMDKDGKDKFNITLPPEITVEVLTKLGIVKEEKGQWTLDFDFYSLVADKDCCFRAFLRGLFISSGLCTVPSSKDNNTKYHLEIVFGHSIPAQDTAGRLFKNGISTRIIRRKSSCVLYIKSAEEIKDFIAFLPAPVSVLKLTDIMIEREMINDINRAKNCDMGNLTRQVEASARQTLAIEKIQKTKGLDYLKKDLKETAIARLENREDSLVDLAERLGITKSCLNHRLRKIIEIAKEIEE